MMENTFLSFNAFKSINEKDEKGSEEAKKKETVELPKEDKVDASGGQYKEMNIDGKDYMAVLSTLTAIGSKQEAMGEKKVGIISLPGDEKVYELVPKNEGGEEKKDDTFNESKDVVSTIEADKFIAEVLKMGSRDNLFDKFIKKEKINPDELSMLVSLVADRLKEKWS